MFGKKQDPSQAKPEARNAAEKPWAFHELFEYAADAHFIVDVERGEFSNYNPAFLRMVGLSQGETMVSIKPTSISPERQPDGRLSSEKASEMIANALRDGATQFEWVHRHADGSDFLVEVTLNSIPGYERQYIYGHWQDITQRKQAENKLRTFQMLVENVPDGVVIGTGNADVIYANPAMLAMHGYEQDEMIGLNLADFLAEDDMHRLTEMRQSLQETGRWQETIKVRRKDGSVFPVQVLCFVLKDGGDTTNIAIVRDLTEQQQAQRERDVLQEQIIEAQRASIRELSTPLIPLTDQVILMPLIGNVDTQRAQQVMETLLDGISSYRAKTVILDITGVAVVDTQVAQALIRSAQAVRLLGARVVLTGIGPTMAQTLVHLGVDLSSIVTQGSLQSGIAYAMKHQ